MTETREERYARHAAGRRAYQEQLQRYREFQETRGFRDSKAQHCPRVVLGKQCIRYSPRRGWGSAAHCVCETWQQGYGVWDHTRIWLYGDRQYALTLEPYALIDDPRLQEFREHVEASGFNVEITQDSPWNPGATILIVVTRANA